MNSSSGIKTNSVVSFFSGGFPSSLNTQWPACVLIDPFLNRDRQAAIL